MLYEMYLKMKFETEHCQNDPSLSEEYLNLTLQDLSEQSND